MIFFHFVLAELKGANWSSKFKLVKSCVLSLFHDNLINCDMFGEEGELRVYIVGYFKRYKHKLYLISSNTFVPIFSMFRINCADKYLGISRQLKRLGLLPKSLGIVNHFYATLNSHYFARRYLRSALDTSTPTFISLRELSFKAKRKKVSNFPHLRLACSLLHYCFLEVEVSSE